MFDRGDSIDQSGDNNLAFLNSEVNIVVSIYDEIDQLIRNGKFNKVAELMKQVNSFIGTKHPFYPHYRYKPVQFGDTVIYEHEPLTSEAKDKYPLSMKGTFKIPKEKLDGYNTLDELIEDAYFKQEEIEINMTSLTTWLGDTLVETPNLDASLSSAKAKWVISPKPLPEPLKLSLYFKGKTDITIIDYLEMGISGKEDNKFILIDNSKQKNTKLLVSLVLPINSNSDGEYISIHDATLNLKIKNEFRGNVEALRSLLYFFKLTSDKSKKLALKNLSENNDFLIVSNVSFNGDVTELEKDYHFFDRLFKVEKYYNLTFTVPEILNQDNWESLEILERSMENKPIIKKLQKVTMTFTEKEPVQNILSVFDSEKIVKKLKLTNSRPEGGIEFFNVVIPIEKVESIYNSVQIVDLDRLHGKLEYMDEGESIKIVFIPGEDPEFKQFYYFKTASEI
ncbi:hypothetical protein [Bacillus sp. H1m]|uniref:hypothetical protein n=1 Tax=Bacillus sp. H1m TaxID=1397277 RepID=UPI00046889DC|nr:hypothetical protein [Bacillus sp. H1m]